MDRKFVISTSIILLLISSNSWAKEKWALDISGEQRFSYGDHRIQGSVTLPWKVEINFSIDETNKEFLVGFGRASFEKKPQYNSIPENWIQCEIQDGTFLTAGLKEVSLPTIRFEKFPIGGEILGEKILLKPGFDAPGNYLAVKYKCKTDKPAAVEWFDFAKMAKEEQGKRQSAWETVKENHREVLISEVKIIPPQDAIEIPLQNGWSFSQGTDDSEFKVNYNLKKL